MRTLRKRIEALIEVWGASHADWCCTLGCSSPDGRHASTGAVEEYLTRLGAGEDPGVLATEPCTGECSCDVGLYLTSLRATLAGAR